MICYRYTIIKLKTVDTDCVHLLFNLEARASCAITSRLRYCVLSSKEAWMSVYGMDLRRKVVAALGKGHSVAAVARRFDVDEKTVRSYRRRAAWDRLAPDRGGPKGHRKLTDDDLRTLEREVAKDPGVTLRQLRGKLSVPVAESTCAGRSRSWGCH